MSLCINAVSVRFGGVVALDSVDFKVERGEICGLIGPNGAGKTTLFNCISRIYHPSAGGIEFDGTSLLGLSLHEIAGVGIGRTFQNLALFANMSARENIATGAHAWAKAGYVATAFQLASVREEERRIAIEVDRLVRFLDIESIADRAVATLPFGTRKRVELGRALMMRPKLLLLDEPAGGLNFEEVERLKQLIRDIRDRLQITVLLVEHHMNLVMTVSDHVVVLNFGRKIADGDPSSVRRSKDVIEAYLGGA
jgi:branched-chain amino acid transport system ATP-binding protein